MKGARSRSLLVALLFVAVIAGLALAPAGWSQEKQEKKAVLTPADCIKCHAGPPADIAANGAGHKKITCMDCHTGHRPAVKDNIPKCGMCHQGKKHYELAGCLGCHKNPHTPLKITFASNTTDPCLTCHTQQIKQLQENKSKHTLLFCATCHNVHGKKPECTQCHKPHSTAMTAADCGKCHKAHMPKVVTYASEVPSKDCGACHKKALDMLAASKAKHRTFACAFCHQAKHKMVPKCQDCHGMPHPAGMMAKFPKCGDCHGIAHDLNNWQAAEKPAEKKEAAPPAKKKK